MREQGGDRRLRRLQWLPVLLCTVAVTINYMDRATVAVGTPQLRAEFGLTATQIGSLVSVWSLCFALSQLPMGWLIDRLGSRSLLAAALMLWSLAQMAGGLVGGFGQLLWTRGVLGVGEAPAYPTSARVVTRWFRPEQRGVPTGVFNVAGSLGPALAPPILTVLMLSFGWRVMFLAIGGLGVLAAVVWFALYREPEKAALSEVQRAELRIGEAGSTGGVTFREWTRLFLFRTTWGMIAGMFGLGYVIWIFQAWLPSYLETQHHISIGRTGFYASIPWVCGVFGSLAGGYISDWAARRGMGLIASRKLAAVGGLIGLAVFTLLAGEAGNYVWALVFISAAMFCAAGSSSGIWTMPGAVTPRNYVASTGSIQNCGAFLGATISPTLTGIIVDATGSFQVAMLIGAAVAVISGALYWLLVRRPIDPVALRGAMPGGTAQAPDRGPQLVEQERQQAGGTVDYRAG